MQHGNIYRKVTSFISEDQMKQFSLGLAIALQLLGQSSEIYVQGLSVLKLGTSKTDVMKAIPETFELHEEIAGPPVTPQSEANQRKPDTAWMVRRKGDADMRALLFFSNGRLQTVQRFSPIIRNDDPAKLLFKELFGTLKEETDKGNVEATVKTTTQDHITFVERTIEFRIGGRSVSFSMPEGQDSDGSPLTGITITKSISQ
jgi:hypothetical protein